MSINIFSYFSTVNQTNFKIYKMKAIIESKNISFYQSIAYPPLSTRIKSV